jgi:hypothetical protein
VGVLALAVRLSGRPWWQARYTDGRVVSEWETVPGVSRLGARPREAIWGRSGWEDLKKAGMIGLRLLTPEGAALELEARAQNGTLLDGRFIQIRQTALDLAIMPGGGKKKNRRLVFNLIGVVGDDGAVMCRSYETETHAYVDDLGAFPSVCVTCRLPRESCGGRDVTTTTREVLDEWVPDKTRPEAVMRSRRTEVDYHGLRRPIVAWTDNVYAMRYRNLGALNLEAQGVRL